MSGNGGKEELKPSDTQSSGSSWSNKTPIKDFLIQIPGLNPNSIESINAKLTAQEAMTVEDLRLWSEKDLTDVGISKTSAKRIMQALGSSLAPGSSSVPDSTEGESNKRRIQFWEAIQQANVENNFLTLPSGVFFMGNSQFNSSILIRKPYNDLLQQILNAESGTKWIIKGNPGIGKSCFMLYLFWVFAKNPIVDSILWERVGIDDCYHFKKHAGVRIVKFGEAIQSLHENQTVHLIDGKAPHYDTAFHPLCTVLVSSPNKSVWHTFAKESKATIRYMPVFTWDEIAILWYHSYHQSISEQQLKILYLTWGGVPRYVLEKAKDSSQQKMFDDALAQVKLQDIIRSVGEVDSKEDASHKILHIIVEEDYIHTKIRFATDYVAQRVAYTWETQNKADLVAFLKSSEGEAIVGALRGHLFEGFVHNILQKGGEFEIRSLGDNKKGIAKIHQTNPFFFESLDAMKSKLKTGDYGRPISKTFTSIDSLILRGGFDSNVFTLGGEFDLLLNMETGPIFFQITVSQEHPVKLHGIEEVASKLNSNGVWLVFVVPPASYIHGFKNAQPYLTTEGQVIKIAPKVLVRQFVLNLPLY